MIFIYCTVAAFALVIAVDEISQIARTRSRRRIAAADSDREAESPAVSTPPADRPNFSVIDGELPDFDFNLHHNVVPFRRPMGCRPALCVVESDDAA